MPVFVPSVCCKSRWLPISAALLLISGVAACGGKTAKDSGTIAWSEPGSSSVAPAGSVVPSGPPLTWQTALSGDTVTVEMRDTNDYYRVERIEMVGPDGTTLTAGQIDRETNRNSGSYGGDYGGGPSVGVGVGGWGGSRSGSSVGVGLGFPLGGSRSSNPPPPPVMTITRARIRLPDPEAYGRTAANWVIRVTTTDRANQSNVAVFPAPRPPA